MTQLNLFLCVLLGLSANYVVRSEKVLICYYGSWATYRHGLGKFDVENINSELCSHLVYTFVGINSQGNVVSLDSFLDLPDSWGKNNFGKFNALKQQNPKVKTLLAVGGWNEGSAKYSIMAANPTLRSNFVSSALKMVLDHGFDGFDLDWEYPGRRDSVYGQADIDNFTQLLKELKEEFDKYGLLLTAAVSAVKNTASLSYNIAAISEYLDYISIMTYDMYGAWDPVTGHNAPLHKGEGDENADRESLFTVDVAVEYWLASGCPPEKLVVGLALYGRTFTLANANVNGVRAPSSGPGIAGPYTVSSGSIGYNEFCEKLKRESWDVRTDSQAKVPYAVQNSNWVSYDDVASIAAKVEYGLNLNVAGFMVWSIETDDFNGVCGETYPLLKAINKAVENFGFESTTIAAGTTAIEEPLTSTPEPSTTKAEPSTTTPEPTTTSESSTVVVPTFTETSTTTVPSSTSAASAATTESPPEEVDPETSICKAEGFLPKPTDCASFYICVRDVDGDFVPKEFDCPKGLLWDADNLYCNYPESVSCN